MGTSRARKNPGGRAWTSAGRKTASRSNAAEAADSVVKAVLPALPNGPVKTPIYIGTTEALKFGMSVKRDGFEEAVKRYAISRAGSKAGSAIGQHIWDSAIQRHIEPVMDPTTSTILSNAFKQTFSVIGKKGAEAYGKS